MPRPSPWHGATADGLAVPGHSTASCPFCSVVASQAYRRGQAAARAAAAVAGGAS